MSDIKNKIFPPDEPELTIRLAVSADSRNVWAWRNDPLTRSNSTDQTEVTWDSHIFWFEGLLKDPDRKLYIGITTKSDDQIGMVRFDRSEDGGYSEVSINLNPAWRGKGMASLLLYCAIEKYSQEFSGKLIANIRPNNKPSLSIFQKCGFRVDGRPADILVLTRQA